MPNRPAPRRALVLTTLALALLVAGCGSGDEEATTDPGTSTSSEAPASGSPSSSVSATPAEDPSSSSTFSVPAATGPGVESDAFTANLPKGWTRDDANGSSTLTVGYDSETGADVSFGYFPAAPGSTLDSYEKAALKTWGYGDGKPGTRSRVDVNGVEMFRHTGRTRSGRTVEVFGAPHEGLAVEVEFHFPTTMPRAEQRKLMESTLASIAWT